MLSLEENDNEEAISCEPDQRTIYVCARTKSVEVSISEEHEEFESSVEGLD